MPNAQPLLQAESEDATAAARCLQSPQQQSGWPSTRGERVPGSSVAVNSLSSETADKDVKRGNMKKTHEPQIAKL